MYFRPSLILIVCLHVCKAEVIFSLNDTEHDRMPPLFALDDYERCLRHGGTYCVVRLNLFADPRNELMKLIHDYSAYTTKHYNYSFVERGVCVDKTCRDFLKDKNITNKVDLTMVLERCLNKSIWESYGLQSNISHVFNCDKNTNKSNISTLDWIVLGISLMLFVMNIVGSFYDILTTKASEDAKDEIGNKYLLSFSVIRNWKWMVTLRVDDKFGDLSAFNGTKTVVTLFVVLAHAMFIISVGFSDNTHDFEKVYEYPHYQIIFNGMAMVQVFFVISGFLLVYSLHTAEMAGLSWVSVPKIVFYRWCRLTPPYAMLMAFNTTWLRHVGSGPVWGLYVTSTVVADCRKYWWLHLLYLNNFQPDDKLCALQTWHVAADMQLFLIGLLVYFATQHRGRNLVLALLLLVGMVAPAMHVWLQDLDGVMLLTPETYRSLNNATFGLMHNRGYNNLAGYAVGMAVGSLVHQLRNRNVDLRNYKAIRYASWFIMPGLAGLFYTGRVFYVDGDRASLAVRMVYAATHRVVIAAIAGFGIVAILMKCSDYLQQLFGWRGWLVPGKLSYAVYLLHMNIVHIMIGLRRQLVHVSFFYMIVNCMGIVMLSYLLAVPLYLLVEAPISRLVSVTLKGSTKQSNKKDN